MGKRINTAVWNENQKRWRINVQKDGQRKSFYSSASGRTGQREANQKADKWLDEGQQYDKRKVREIYNEFVEREKIRVSRAGWERAESVGRLWILPVIGNKNISNVTFDDYQTIIDHIVASKLSKKYVSNIRGIISLFTKYCRRKKLSAISVEDLEVPTNLSVKPKHVLQPNDLAKLFSCTETSIKNKMVPDEFVYAYRLEVVTGMRPGEILGLRWSDIDDHGINVARAINTYKQVTKGKNQNAVRRIPLTALSKQILEKQKQISTTESVFEISSQSTYAKRWKRFCVSNDIPITTLYELRHTFVSIAAALPEGKLKPLVGHSKNMDTFGVYGHEFGEQLKKSADVINNEFIKLLSNDEPIN